MVIMNAASDKQTLNLDRFSEMLAKGQNGIDISENKAVLMDDKLELEPWDVKVIELK